MKAYGQRRPAGSCYKQNKLASPPTLEDDGQAGHGAGFGATLWTQATVQITTLPRRYRHARLGAVRKLLFEGVRSEWT